jgi:hypothetical protein
MRSRIVGLLLSALVVPLAAGIGHGAPVLRVRVSAELSDAVSTALGDRGLEATIDIGNPAVTAGADIVVGRLGSLTRALEGGDIDERTAVELGVVEGDASGPSHLVAAAVTDAPHATEAAAFLAVLRSSRTRQVFARRAGALTAESFRAQAAFVAGTARYALAISDWWLPNCSLAQNAFKNPNEILGAPNAVNLGGKDNYAGMMSLGQGGWVVVDMGQTITNLSGNDIRVHQTTGEEPLTLYAGDAPNGPFRLVTFRRKCGNLIPGGANYSRYCDFDLGEGGVASARYLKLEDGELYPCVRGGTVSEGVDIDAVELLNQ